MKGSWLMVNLVHVPLEPPPPSTSLASSTIGFHSFRLPSPFLGPINSPNYQSQTTGRIAGRKSPDPPPVPGAGGWRWE
jgi:hypothetical protein